ncbi:hypothetical protein SEA_BANTAM_50 [Gordonia phage Bantam]|uniref:Uncharacterized protein n=1 Tax=Gordonia phage Bantam TaxID=1887641 RepID=A0A1B3AYC2_9CAUD|nr:hypothetical protein BIZ77_gp128 [Gordonia phage Bantam]AOE43740.1 hypothetical protein SEA_BANTAM_50 [Gordonia phage Bantam]
MSTIFTAANPLGDSITVSKNSDGEFEFLTALAGEWSAAVYALPQVEAARLFATVFAEMDGSTQALTRTWMGDR